MKGERRDRIKKQEQEKNRVPFLGSNFHANERRAASKMILLQCIHCSFYVCLRQSSSRAPLPASLSPNPE